jgi:hypothetical protein
MIDDLMDYVICLPSGEVIDMTNAEIMHLRRLGLVKPNDTLLKFVCDDMKRGEVYRFLTTTKYKSTKPQIEKFLDSCGLERDHYTIFEDGESPTRELSVDVYTELDISYKNLFKIPFKLNRVTSHFNCSYNRLVTLENSPKQVHGDFNCGFNFLKNLKYGPRLVSGIYLCNNNKLISLEGAPPIVNHFNCSDNKLKSLDYIPKVKHNLNYSRNPLENKHNGLNG